MTGTRIFDGDDPPAVPGTISNGYTPMPLTIANVAVVRDDGPAYIRLTVDGVSHLQGVQGLYRPQGAAVWTAMTLENAVGETETRFLRTGPLEDRRQYDLQVRTTGGLFAERAAGFAEVTGVEVFANDTPPDAPQVVTKTASGTVLTITFAPDLGVNYERTGLYRAAPGGAFANAVRVGAWSYSRAAEVTAAAGIPAGGARFWLQSENASGVPSAPTLVGQFS